MWTQYTFLWCDVMCMSSRERALDCTIHRVRATTCILRFYPKYKLTRSERRLFVSSASSLKKDRSYTSEALVIFVRYLWNFVWDSSKWSRRATIPLRWACETGLWRVRFLKTGENTSGWIHSANFSRHLLFERMSTTPWKVYDFFGARSCWARIIAGKAG